MRCACLMACLLPALGPAVAGTAAPASAPASRPVKRSQTPEAIERTAQYYLELYGRYLKTPDPLARTMVVISLARLDDPRATEKLIHVMLRDRAPVVRVYAWEALHARCERLTDAQRTQWVRAGFDLDRLGFLRGDLRVGLVAAMAVAGPTPANKARFQALFAKTSSLAPGDIRTLDAMGRLLADWKSPALVRWLIEAMKEHDTAWRAEYVLRRLGSGIPPAQRTMHKLGSVESWRRTREAWSQWLRTARLSQVRPGEGGYRGGAGLLPAGEKITDASDPKWRKDLELERFSLRQLDVGFVIDSTGSMGPCVQWIRSDVLRIMRAFELISREPRIGVTLYRDYGDEYLVKPIPLSDSAEKLSEALRGAAAKGGGDVPEAVHDALSTIARTYRWSGPTGRKVIVLMGDAPPHRRSLEDIDALVVAGVKRGFVFYAVKIESRYRSKRFKRDNYDPKLETFDRIAARGGGRSFWIRFHTLQSEHRNWGVAGPRKPDAPERVILREILKAAMATGYEDRVNAFVNVLEQYIERTRPEKRRVIPPYRKPRRPPPPPKPPRDPQAQ